MPVGKLRVRVLYGLLAKRHHVHRYTWIRWAVGIAFTAAIAALPFFDVLRFDLWRGGHRVLGEPATLVEAAKAFAFPFLAINVAIVLVSRFLGRYLCGFVCPVGSLARLGEWARFRSRKKRFSPWGPLALLGVSALLASIVFAFWVDWRVFSEGSPTAITLASLFLGGTTLGLFVTVEVVGLRFCRGWCPSGVYFAVLGQQTSNGVEFAEPASCTDCGICEKVCPMDLHPRQMSGGAYREGQGIYGDHMSNFALCIRCGDCVAACEGVGSKGGVPAALRMGPLPKHARESRDVGARAAAE